jgi:hypothetical protein
MGICIYFLKDFNIILVIVLGIIIYLITLIIIKGINNEDFDLLKNLFKKI